MKSPDGIPAEDKFLVFLEHAPAAIAMFDRGMRYIAYSRRWMQDFNLTGEILGRSHYEVFPEIPQHWREVHARCLTGAVEKCDEERFERADGSVNWVKWEVRPWYDSAGGIGGILIFSEDVSERKRAEEALRQTASQLHLIANTAPVFIAHCDSEARYTFVNQPYAARFHLSPADCIGKHISDVLGSAAYETIRTYVEAALRGMTVEFEEELPYKDIGTHFMHCSYAPDFDVGGNVQGFVAAITDITQRRQTEEALRESEQQLRTLADTVPQLVWMAHADGRIFWYNQKWYDYTGTTPNEMEGWGWQSVHDPKMLPNVLDRWRASLRTGEPFEMEFPLKRADGVFRWFLTRVNPLKDSRGRISGWFGTNTDVEDSRRARQAAEESSRMKDEFLATLSHELRTPLNSILGWAQILRSGPRNPSESAAALESIYRNAKSQAQLIEDLLDVSRIITGNLQLDMQRVRLRSVIQEAVDAVRPTIQAKRLHLSTDLDAFATVAGDPQRLQQILWNLLSNAVKFTPEGGRIELGLAGSSSIATITVKDSGKGIEQDFLPHLFERFSQADSSSRRKHGGLGIGLAIVRHLVELHGGEVHASSEGETRGSTFTVTLPLWRAEIHSRLPIRDSSRPAARVSGLECAESIRGRRILLVDDEPDTLEMLKTVLARCHAEVRVCESAQSALETLTNWNPDILISDIAMPGQDGYSLIEAVRKLAPQKGRDIPAVALTAYARVEDRIRVLSAGFQMYVPKPVEPSELLAVLESLLGAGTPPNLGSLNGPRSA